MKFQNSYIFLKNPYKKVKKTEEKDGTVTLNLGPNVYSYIKKSFPAIKKVENYGNIYKRKYTCRLEADKYKCDVEFIKTEVSEIEYLDITVDGKTQIQAVRCLEDAQSTLLSSGIRESYIDIISYDSVSEYYCNKISPKLNALERDLRKLMFNIYTLNFGRNYYQATISDEIQTKIKGVIKAKGNEEKKEIKRLQEFFYSLEFADIQKMLFVPSWTSIDEQKRKDFLGKNNVLSELSDEELRKAFSDFSPKSDWERFFSKKITITNIEEIIEQIRIYRNLIAHFKFFCKADYDSCVKLINELDSAVLNAIRITEEKDFAEKNAEIFKDLLSGFAEKMSAVINPIIQTTIQATQKFMQSETFQMLSNMNKMFRDNGVCQKLGNFALKSALPESLIKQETALASIKASIPESVIKVQETLNSMKAVLPDIPDIQPHFLRDIQREQEALRSSLVFDNMANINNTLNSPNFANVNINSNIEILQDKKDD